MVHIHAQVFNNVAKYIIFSCSLSVKIHVGKWNSQHPFPDYEKAMNTHTLHVEWLKEEIYHNASQHIAVENEICTTQEMYACSPTNTKYQQGFLIPCEGGSILATQPFVFFKQTKLWVGGTILCYPSNVGEIFHGFLEHVISY